jgi:XTP/dITP diphosphohydrolase
MFLVVATKNQKKLGEIKEILRGFNFKLRSLADYGKTPDVVENGVTFKENAIKKALELAHFTGELTLGEDSGLCVDALGGRPGVYSSRFAGESKSDEKNNQKLLRLLKNMPLNKRRAHYVCAVALADKHGLIGVVEGKCYGRIDFELKGNHGFGYDPLFLIPKFKKTFGELDEKIKHTMSHRYRALNKAKKVLLKYVENKKSN